MKHAQQLIMTLGMTQNNWELTKEAVENSINSFANVPIVWNKQQEYKNYSDTSDYLQNRVIGFISSEPYINIIDNNVYADIFIKDEYDYLWQGRFDNWCIQFDDNMDNFKLFSIEIF